MPLPISERITQDIVAAVQTVMRSNGYLEDVIVERREQWGNIRADKKCVVYEGNPTETPINDVQLGWQEQITRYGILCHILESETSDVPIDERLNIIAADVQKAVMVDPQRAGLAVDTLPGMPQKLKDANGAIEAVLVFMEVRFRHLQFDPYRGYN